jgi:hypothetical protein
MKMKLKLFILGAITIIGLSGCGNSNHANHSSDEKAPHEAGHSANEKSADQDKLQVTFSFDETPKSAMDNDLTIQVNDELNKPIKNFEVEHEKLMHLIVVSKDLSYFDHIHPDYQGNGKFTVRSNFPNGGEYKLFADFVPEDSSKVVKSEVVQVEGNKKTSIPLKEEKLTKVVEGKEVTLTFEHVMAGMELELNFNLTDAKTKEPISNLQPYLGAVGHVVIISGDTNTYLHVHPMEEKASGPDAKFMTTFPESGIYKIWGQFQQNGKVFTVPFTINVPK